MTEKYILSFARQGIRIFCIAYVANLQRFTLDSVLNDGITLTQNLVTLLTLATVLLPQRFLFILLTKKQTVRIFHPSRRIRACECQVWQHNGFNCSFPLISSTWMDQ